MEQSGEGFDGIVAVVTGGSRGIGLATARLLVQRGARAVSVDLAPPPEGCGVGHEHLDVSDEQQTTAVFDRIAEQLGGIDVLVNNAGISAVGAVEVNPMADWHRVFGVNVFGMVHASRAALPHLRRSTHAAIVNVSSIAATIGLPDRALYGSTKGAVLGLTVAMAADMVADGIRVNCVSPGTADTPFVAGLLAQAADADAERTALEGRQPIGRLVTPEEVARAIAYLADPGSASTTGTVLAVDGGFGGLRLRPQ